MKINVDNMKNLRVFVNMEEWIDVETHFKNGELSITAKPPGPSFIPDGAPVLVLSNGEPLFLTTFKTLPNDMGVGMITIPVFKEAYELVDERALETTCQT
jgi:hypothetical protein